MTQIRWQFKSGEDTREVGFFLLASADPHQSVQQVCHDLLTHDGVLLVLLVLVNELSHPLRQGQALSFHFILDKSLYALQNAKNLCEILLLLGAVCVRVLQHPPDKSKKPGELVVLTSEEDLPKVQLSDFGSTLIEYVRPKEELFLEDGAFMVCSIEVFIDLRDWDVEVQGGGLRQHLHQAEHQQRKSRILVSSELDLHRPEFDSPSHSLVEGHLEPHGVPVRGVDHLEEAVVVLLYFSELLVHHYEVPTCQSPYVVQHLLVDRHLFFNGLLLQKLHDFFIYADPLVVIFRPVLRGVPDVVIHGRIAALRLVLGTGGVQLLRGPIIHTILDNLPPGIPVREFSLQYGRCCSQRQEQRTENMHHIVYVRGLLQISRPEGTLQTGHAHSEPHGIHVYFPGKRFLRTRPFQISLFIRKQRNQYLNFPSAPFPNVLGEGPEARVVRNVRVAEEQAFRDVVLKMTLLCFSLCCEPQKRHGGYRQVNPLEISALLVASPHIPDDFEQVAVREVRLLGYHLKHPSTIFQHQWERGLSLREWCFHQLVSLCRVLLETVPFDFIPPSNEATLSRVVPFAEFLHPLEELERSHFLHLLLMLD